MEKHRYPLSRLTSLGVGGAADRLVFPETAEELAAELRRASDDDLPVRALGGGKNLLVDDRGVPGAVISLERMRRLTVRGSGVTAGAGVPTGTVVSRTVRNGLDGLLCLVGVPGTVGGAVRMNAGGVHGSVGECVREVRGLTAGGEPFTFGPEACGFGYRTSRLAGTFVTEVVFELERSEEDLSRRVREIYAAKRFAQPLEAATAGCMFRNPGLPGGESAGKLIDLAGLKGHVAGGARISPKHANFVENRGDATSMDIGTLVATARSRVFAEFGVELELEVEIWSREESALLVA
ncbi:MAG: UDP-N-acetylmuramate dehydrogenase [Planctomycetota bacterium]